MRYNKGRKEASHRLIVEVAVKRFREDGIAASGVAGIMGDAGLTNGAFYPHFESKEELVRECVSTAQIEQSKLLRRYGTAYHNISITRTSRCVWAWVYFGSIAGRALSSVIRNT